MENVQRHLADGDGKRTSGYVIGAPAYGQDMISFLVGAVRHVVDAHTLLLVRQLRDWVASRRDEAHRQQRLSCKLFVNSL